MSDIQIEPATTRSLRRQFLNLPEKLHGNDPNWVPRIRASENELVGFAKHPFAEIATSNAFVAVSNGEVCGRIVAIDNSVHGERHPNDQVGFVGFFECCDDIAISNALFAAAENWLGQRGLKSMRGPVSPSMNYEAGLLVEGFDCPPTFMMPYNPEYYVPLWTNYGFEKVQDLYAFVGNQSVYQGANKAWSTANQAAERFGATFRTIDRSNFVGEIQTFLRLYNAGSAGTWGFVPFSDKEIEHLGKELKHLILPEMTSFMIVDGQTIGATFGLLDYNPIIKQIRGRIFPFGFLSLLFKRKSIKRSRCMSINVLPEFQRWGLGLCLLDQFLEQGRQFGIRDVEFSYVLESNRIAVSALTKSGVPREKTYRIYEKTTTQKKTAT